jgi:hypothetical protein
MLLNVSVDAICQTWAILFKRRRHLECSNDGKVKGDVSTCINSIVRGLYSRDTTLPAPS